MLSQEISRQTYHDLLCGNSEEKMDPDLRAVGASWELERILMKPLHQTKALAPLT
jgi:hypothetical protein